MDNGTGNGTDNGTSSGMSRDLAPTGGPTGTGLVNPAALLLRDAKTATTRRAYASALRHFFAWAGYVNPAGGPDPSPGQVQDFLSHTSRMASQIRVDRERPLLSATESSAARSSSRIITRICLSRAFLRHAPA